MPVNNGIIFFCVGGVVGGVAGYFIAKKKFEKDLLIKEEELQSVINSFSGYSKEEKPEKEKVENGDAEQRAWKERIERYTPTEVEDEDIEGPVETADVPYTIPYDVYANDHLADFDKRTLLYYENDDILVNDEGEILNIDFYIGKEWRDHIGDEEADIVRVRNEKHCVDYEVQVTHKNFREED